MKVKIKKTGEIVNAADYARVALDQCDSWGSPIELPLDEIELIPDDTSSEEIEYQKRVIHLAEMMFISPVFGGDPFDRYIGEAEEIIEMEDKYIKDGFL